MQVKGTTRKLIFSLLELFYVRYVSKLFTNLLSVLLDSLLRSDPETKGAFIVN